MGGGLVTYQDILAVHDYQGASQAELYRRSDFGWDPFDPQPTWRTNAQAQAVWSGGYVDGEIVVHDSISAERFMHYDGSSWSNVTGFRGGVWVCEALNGIAPDKLWAGGEGYLGYYDGTSWTQVLGYLAELDPVYSIWVKNENEVWVVGGSGGSEGVYRYLNGTWSNLYADIEAVTADVGVPMAVWGEYTGQDVWVVFDLCTNPSVSGRFAHFNGVSWAIIGGAIAEGQQATWGIRFDGDEVWIAGDDSAGASPIISGWTGLTWDDKLTATYVARRMLGFQAGPGAGVYLATGTGASQNGKIYRRDDRADEGDDPVWLDDQAPLRQWRDLAVRETDEDPPDITPVDPYDGETGVDKDAPIIFTVTDALSGVVFSTVQAWVRGARVFNGGQFIGNWSGSYEAIADGWKITMRPGRLAYYDHLEEVQVRAYAEDEMSLQADETWTFTAGREIGLGIYPMLFDGTRRADEEN